MKWLYHRIPLAAKAGDRVVVRRDAPVLTVAAVTKVSVESPVTGGKGRISDTELNSHTFEKYLIGKSGRYGGSEYCRVEEPPWFRRKKHGGEGNSLDNIVCRSCCFS